MLLLLQAVLRFAVLSKASSPSVVFERVALIFMEKPSGCFFQFHFTPCFTHSGLGAYLSQADGDSKRTIHLTISELRPFTCLAPATATLQKHHFVRASFFLPSQTHLVTMVLIKMCKTYQ